MSNWMDALLKPEPVAIVVLVVLLGSLIQGMRRGASGSARRLFYFVCQAVIVVASLALAGKTASWLSPIAKSWLQARHIEVPREQLGVLQQLWYTFITSARDFELLRFGLLFLLAYWFYRFALSWIQPLGGYLFDVIGDRGDRPPEAEAKPLSAAASRTTGAAIGVLLGAGRSLIVLLFLFVYVTVLPSGPLTEQIRASTVYNKTAQELLDPVAGDVLRQGPILTEAVEAEFRKVLQRKYEVIDAAVPEDIAQAAATVTADAKTDKEKARALYDWVGTRVAYDWDKANNYEQRGEWKEQTPEDTFRTRKGVCIDVARLYAVMARSVGLDVQVVTGLGIIGDGSSGPHAWNEVKLADQGGVWIPLDATWAASGDWFDPDRFADTHIRET